MAMLVALIALATLSGWLCDLPWLRAWGAGLPPQAPATALAFLMLAASIVAAGSKLTWLRETCRWLASAVIAIAVVSLVQDLDGGHARFDVWLATRIAPPAARAAVQMPTATAVMLAGTAVAILVSGDRRRGWVAAVLVTAVAMFAMAELILLPPIGSEPVRRVPVSLSTVPVPTIVAFLVLCGGLLLSRGPLEMSLFAGRRVMPHGIAAWLLVLATAAALPVLVFAGVAAQRLATAERQAMLQALERRTESAADKVERYLQALTEFAVTMAETPMAIRQDWPSFYDFAQRALRSGHVGRAVTIVGPDGRMLLNTRRPFGEALPAAMDVDGVEATLKAGGPHVGNLFKGAVAGISVFTVWVPVERDGEVQSLVGVSVEPDDLTAILREERLPAGWVGVVVDRNGIIAGRTSRAETLVGQPAARQFELGGTRGHYSLVNKDGIATAAYFVRLPSTDWTISVGVMKSELEASANTSLRFMLALGLAALSTAVVLAFQVGRHMSRQIGNVARAAFAVGEGRAPECGPTTVRELDEVTAALVAANRLISGREAHARLLMREVNHRAKNLLAVVQSVAQQTAGSGEPRSFAERFASRLRGLAASQDLLVRSEWRGVDLADLLRTQLSHYTDLIGTRIELDGPPLHLQPSAAQAIGMAIHELATNAGKYGAMASPTGRIDVQWGLRNDAGSDQFHISWIETGGPPPRPDPGRGFGHTVVVGMAEYALDGVVELSYPATGACWRLTAPAARTCAIDGVQAEHEHGTDRCDF